MIAEYMLINGNKRNPMITGSSVHNQRIERLWRDTYRCVLSIFYQVFYHLEDNQVLDPTSDLDLFCLHFVYLQKINDALKAFMTGWNNHALTTENNKTPIQLYACGILFSSSSSSMPPGYSFDSDLLELPNVTVPDTTNPLSTEQYTELNTLIGGHSPDSTDATDDYGMNSYLQVRRYVRDHSIGT